MPPRKKQEDEDEDSEQPIPVEPNGAELSAKRQKQADCRKWAQKMADEINASLRKSQ